MKPAAKIKIEAFTLLELLALIFILMILAALLLPAKVGRGPNHTGRCMSNQRQISLGFLMWKTDNSDHFPWEMSTNGNIGTMEHAVMGDAAPNFKILSSYLKSPAVFICPSEKTRTAATDYSQLDIRHLSYFLARDKSSNDVFSVLLGDRHLENSNKPVPPGLFVYADPNRMKMSWTHELHPTGNPAPTAGILSFYDGHVERVKGINLNTIFQREGLSVDHLCIP